MVRVLLGGWLILAATLPATAKDPPKLDPVERNHRHLRAILTIVKKNQKQNEKQCRKIVKKVEAYTRKHKKDFDRIRARIKAMSKKERQRLGDKAERRYTTLFERYGQDVATFSINCHEALHDLEAAIDRVMSIGKPPEHHKEDCECEEHEHK